MGKKVRLPKELTEAIESIRNSKMWSLDVYNLDNIMRNGINTPESSYGIIYNYLKQHSGYGYRHGLSDVKIKKYFDAVVNGYEVETKEDALAKRYRFLMHGGGDQIHEADGIKYALDMLGITIEGINDKEDD